MHKKDLWRTRWPVGVVATLVFACIGFPHLVHAQYTETFQTWSATVEDSWETRDLSGAPFNVPANAVVEVAVRNSRATFERGGGVRAVGSSLDRRFAVVEAEAGGVSALIMHVQTDASSDIQHYSANTGDVDFVLLGYWTSGTYIERFDTFTAGANASWQDEDLCPYGMGPSHVAELVMTNDDTVNARSAGVRTKGSSLERRVTILPPAGGGVALATMFVEADTSASATVQLYAQDDTDVDFYLVGYWSTPPRAYTELFADVGSPAADATWEDVDLTVSGVPNSAIAEFLVANEDSSPVPKEIGVRANGSSLSRVLDLRYLPLGGASLGRLHVGTDANAVVEFYHEDVSQAHTFYVTGYWDSCDTSIEYVVSDLGAVTAANSSLGWHINSSEKVAGFEEDASGDPDSWYLDCGTFTALGVLGGSDAEAHGINDSDMVVGWSDNGSGNRRAYTWTSGGGLTDLGTAGSRSDSQALAVNGNSEVAGTVLDFSPAPATNRLAFLYLPSSAYTLGAGMNTLGTLGGTESVGMDVNDSGQVVGGAQNGSGNYRPFRWANGTMSDLGTLGGEAKTADHRADAINSSGNVCGRSYTAAGAKRAFYYDGSMTDLGVHTGGTESWAFGINDSNVVVGTSDATGDVFRAFVWDSTNGLRNLNNLIPTGTGWTLIRATDINNDGFITGWGTNGSAENRAFLLTPTCSVSGGGAAAAAILASGSGITDSDGAFYAQITDSEGASLATVELLNPETGIRIDYEVLDTEPMSPGAPSGDSRMREGFGDDISLPRTLYVATTAIQTESSLMVNMTFTRDEIAELRVDLSELELHVLDHAAGGPTGVWIPAGKTIGESAPTRVVGDSGFIEYSGGTVDYWAVRALGGTFAVGKPAHSNQDTGVPNGPGLCGVGMILPFLVCSMLLGFRRWSGGRIGRLRL